MSIKKVSTSELDAWIDGLASERNVIGVQAKSDRFEFAPLKSAADLKLEYDITILPPKTLFQPAKETLCSFDMTKGYESVVDDSPMVVLGVHPYDLVAIAQMDKIFEEGNSDTRYFAKRNNATIVAVDVQAPSGDTFAGHMGTAHVESGYDVLLTKVGDEYLVDAATEKGEDLISGLGGAPASDEDVEGRKAVWAENDAALKKHDLKAGPSEWPALLEKSLDNPIWEEKAEKCFSCGSCNLACPTCYCFDVQDDVNWDLSSGERVRTWDSCILI